MDNSRNPPEMSRCSIRPTVAENDEGPLFACQFQACKEKCWLNGFSSQKDLDDHLVLHRCQWLVMKDNNYLEHW